MANGESGKSPGAETAADEVEKAMEVLHNEPVQQKSSKSDKDREMAPSSAAESSAAAGASVTTTTAN